MRRELLPILRCPVCHGEELQLRQEDEDGQEVRCGAVLCVSCRREYPIDSGIIELLPDLDRATLRERQVRDQKVRDWEVERQRPYLNDQPGCPWVWPTFAANVEQGLSQVSLHSTRVLDIGAATCWSTRMMCERGATAVALDISTAMLRDGEAQFATGVYFDRVAATMTALPFVGSAFDIAFASATIHHTAELERALSEIARVLKPGGQAVLVNEPVLGLLGSPSQFGLAEIEHGANEHIYRLREYLRAAQQAGLRSQVLFPAALSGQLDGQLPAPDTPRFRAFQRLWRWLPPAVRTWSLWPGHLLLGLSLAMVARKPLEPVRAG